MKKILFLFLLGFFYSSIAIAALPVAVYEVRDSATAGNVNGCGFNSSRGGVDYTLQDAAQLTATDGASTASTTFTSATGTFTSDMVGNFLHLTAATGTPTVGWYEIVTYTDANNVVLDRVSGTYTAGTFYVGGACSMESSLDDAFFEIFIAGSTVWVKTGTYTETSSMTIAKDGTTALPNNIIGYNSTRGDNPTGSDRPTLSFGLTNPVFAGNYYNFKNFIMTASGPAGVDVGSGAIIENVQFTNASGTAGRIALSADTQNKIINCELISTNGVALSIATGGVKMWGNYIHDSVTGINMGGSVDNIAAFNIIESCTTAISVASTGDSMGVFYNTIYGAETPAGTGITLLATTSTESLFFGNIIYGFTTGATAAAAVESNYWNYNNFYNNTTNRTNVTAGANDLAVDPQFVDAANGNFAIGGNLRAAGIPGSFNGASTTGYLDVGAVQRKEPTDILGDIQ